MESPLSPAAVALALALLTGVAGPLGAQRQNARVTGRVVHQPETGGPRPLSRQWTFVHEIRGDSSRPVDSARTTGAGAYRLAVPNPDTAARYVVATQYAEVDYFSRLLRILGPGLVPVDPIVVYDTTVGGPAMRLERRLFAVLRPGPEAGGGRGVVVQEMVEVANPGARTRIAIDSATPVWTIRLPDGVAEWSMAEGDISPEAMWLDNGVVKVYAPIWPGAPLRASYRYSLDSRTIPVLVDQWTGELNLLVEDTTAQLSGANLTALGAHLLEGRRFGAYRGGPLAAGTVITVRLSRGPLTPEALLPYVVAAAALALGAGLWLALRRRPRETPRSPLGG